MDSRRVMSRGGRLSSALQVADVNDFLTPATACVLPLGGGAVASLDTAPPGSVLAPIIPTATAASTGVRNVQHTAKVTLSDCLSCSGCVTSAETVLLSSANLDTAREVLLSARSSTVRQELYVVVALSQQAVASVAVQIGLSLDEAACVLASFLKDSLHVDCVMDLAFARQFALHESAVEFIDRHQSGEKVVVASACPGWITYAEKTQGQDVLDTISLVRSPQAIAGALVPRLLAEELSKHEGSCTQDSVASARKRTWLMSVMPCHDKKLESSRPNFANDGHPEVECVLTASEILELANELGVDLVSLRRTPLDSRFSVGPHGFGTATGSGSGGYADYVLRVAARELLGVELKDGQRIEMEKVSRSGDVRSVTVRSEDGSRQLRFGTAYGFRSLQSVLRKIRRGECEYDYIELMACPGGCNNGGGQAPAPSTDKKGMASHLAKVEEIYASAKNTDHGKGKHGVVALYPSVVDGVPGSKETSHLLRTSYEKREESAIASLNNW